jgi:hypothetical protein
MKSLTGFIIVGLLGGILLNVRRWWGGSIFACIVMYFVGVAPGRAFLAGFLGLGIAWAILAGWTDTENGGLLSAQIGELFMGMPSFGVVLFTALIGGLSGGLGGMTGAYIRRTPVSRASRS